MTLMQYVVAIFPTDGDNIEMFKIDAEDEAEALIKAFNIWNKEKMYEEDQYVDAEEFKNDIWSNFMVNMNAIMV